MARTFFLGILALLVMAGTSENAPAQDRPPQNTATGAAEIKIAYRLSAREARLLNSLMAAEKKAIVSGTQTMFKASIPQYSSLEIDKICAESKTAGDQKFFNKSLIVRGDITGIYQSAGIPSYLTLGGNSPASGLQVQLSKYLAQKITGYKNGQSAAFACNGGGYAAGVAVLKDCVPIDIYANEVINQFKGLITKFLTGEQVDQSDVPLSAVLIVTLGRVLPDNATCFSSNAQCQAEIMEPRTQAKVKQQVPVVKEELAKLGVKVPR